MTSLKNSLLLSLGLASAAQGLALAGDPPLDATLFPGDSFLGSFPLPGDEDRVRIRVLEGAELTLTARSVGGFRVQPVHELRRDGVTVRLIRSQIVRRNGGRTRILRRIAIDRPGTYEVWIANGGSRLGDYGLLLEEKLPRKVSARLLLQGGQQETVFFPARSGAAVTFHLSTPQSGSNPLLLPVLRSPDGSPISLNGLVQSTANGRRLSIGPVYLTSDGVYGLAVSGLGLQRIKVSAVLSHATRIGSFLVEPPGHASVGGTVSFADGSWLSSHGADDQRGEGNLLEGEILVRVEAGADRARIIAALECTLEGEGASGWLRLRKMNVSGPARIASPSSRLQVRTRK
ncbi:MAG: hypothetical protein V2A76_17745 [Planctomycetota bacterium]